MLLGLIMLKVIYRINSSVHHELTDTGTELHVPYVTLYKYNCKLFQEERCDTHTVVLFGTGTRFKLLGFFAFQLDNLMLSMVKLPLLLVWYVYEFRVLYERTALYTIDISIIISLSSLFQQCSMSVVIFRSFFSFFIVYFFIK